MLPSTGSKVRLDTVAFVNRTSINPKKEFDWIHYTDISSVGPHTVSAPTRFDVADAPGRARRVLSVGDVVLSTVRPNRRSFFQFSGQWERAICSTGFAVVSAHDTKDADYLYAYLTSKEATSHYESICEGGAYPAFNGGLLNEMEVPWPEDKVRQAIGQISRNVRDALTVNEQLAANLEKISQAIFKSWFVDFDPVYAKARGEQPEGMDAETASLFPGSFEDSMGDSIPEGWSLRAGEELFDFSIGRTPPRKEPDWFCDGVSGVPWVSIRDMGGFGAYSSGTDEGLVESAIAKFRVPIVPAGTVLMSFKLTLGRVAIAREALSTNEAIAHFIPRESDSLPTEFAYLWLKNLDYESLDSTSSIGTATNSSLVKKILFLQPSNYVLSKFLELCGPLFEQLKNLTLQNETLCGLRDSLLPRLISGELAIPEGLLGE